MDVNQLAFRNHVEESAVVVDYRDPGITPEHPFQTVRNNEALERWSLLFHIGCNLHRILIPFIQAQCRCVHLG